MDMAHFFRVEREVAGGKSTHTVIHTHDPRFTMELAPDADAPNKVGRGVIKRVIVPNSWAGDYNRYAKFISAAQDFFTKSFADPVSKGESRRLGRI